ncbi:response regulator [Algibacillus agarilyticus]|uniref:response regulator n=1 Tax=Algibacillus agarilyticus TaxID=2234133 RepID=UPI000DD0A0F0|nr:response regulator [Algibacillus agarilyticus]
MPHILLVEDDEDDVYLFKKAFATLKQNCQISDLSDGCTFVEYGLKCQKNPELLPDIILLDLNMPKLDGRQALEKIRTLALFQTTPIIIYTTSESPDDIELCYALGAASFITKPYAFEKLVSILTKIMDYWFNVVNLPAKRITL